MFWEENHGCILPLRFAFSLILEDLFHHVELSLTGLPLQLCWKNFGSLITPSGSLKQMGWGCGGVLCKTYFRRLALSSSPLLKNSGKSFAYCWWIWSLCAEAAEQEVSTIQSTGGFLFHLILGVTSLTQSAQKLRVYIPASHFVCMYNVISLSGSYYFFNF